MERNVATAAVVLALLLAGKGIANAQSRDDILYQNALRLLAEKGWRYGAQGHWDVPRPADFNDDQGPPEYNEDRSYYDDEIRAESEKRSAVATALNAGRRRRYPTPALGKAVTPFAGVGVMDDLGSFMDTVIENVKLIASQPVEEITHDPPTVVNAPASGGGGGSGMNKILSLRPIKPGFGSIRSYKRRSYPGVVYDPRPLWIGLGR